MTTERIGLELAGPGEEAYRITKYLGEGAFGQVFEAIGVLSGSRVAVKLVSQEALDDAAIELTALLNEADLARHVDHPNVVRVLYAATDPANDVGPYIMMEFVGGGTLAKLLRDVRGMGSQVSTDRARAMFTDIARGAQAINEHLIHRDLKPDNILVDGERLRISDFGISKVVAARTRSRTFKGGQHIRYMAPEAWLNETNTIALDIYAVGLVFHEILLLGHPLAASINPNLDPLVAWREAHLFDQVAEIRKMRSDVDDALSQLLSRMVAKRPMERPKWDEILNRISSDLPEKTASTPVTALVDVAIARRQQVLKAESEEARAREARNTKDQSYERSCADLIGRFKQVVSEFNEHYQHGQIECRPSPGPAMDFVLPLGGMIQCKFFFRRDTPIPMRWGRLMGGGFLGAKACRSANLALLVENDDDLYGQWQACYSRINPIFRADEVASELSLPDPLVSPFGFQWPEQFFKEVPLATSALHIVTCELKDPIQVFTEILRDALEHPSDE